MHREKDAQETSLVQRKRCPSNDTEKKILRWAYPPLGIWVIKDLNYNLNKVINSNSRDMNHTKYFKFGIGPL